MNIIIASMDESRVIGNKGHLPWYIPDDLIHFKNITMGHTVIMGRTTWDSIPFTHLPGRLNLVITRNPDKWNLRTKKTRHPVFGPFFVSGLEEAIQSANDDHHIGFDDNLFIIGGMQIYDMALKKGLVDKMIITHVHGEHEGDVYFPPINKKWIAMITDNHDLYSIVTYYKKGK